MDHSSARVRAVSSRDSRAALTADFSHIPMLDGLRACAILFVLVAHFGFSKWVPGGFGVTLFFFISGLLITRLLLAETALTGRIRVGRFYARRMLRLYPALLVAVAASYGVYAAFEGHVLWRDVAAVLLYVSNYYGDWVGFGSGYPEQFQSYVHIGILWSLAVEEQYYIVFPLVFVLLRCNARRLLPALTSLALACLAWRLYLASNGATSHRLYVGTDTRIDSILYGAMLSCILAGQSGRSWLARMTQPGMLCLALLVLLVCFVYRDDFFRDTWRYTLQGLALMPLVAAVCFTDSLASITEILCSWPMRMIGVWSYSIYLTHQLATTLAAMATHEHDGAGFQHLSWRWYAIALTATVTLTGVSYYFVERPFFGLRHRFGSRTVGPVSAA
ncbi:MAG: acyltransferase [Burkholderiaceae bacterium]|nr:acyltransferase [Burkholderiaceae bacterium]